MTDKTQHREQLEDILDGHTYSGGEIIDWDVLLDVLEEWVEDKVCSAYMKGRSDAIIED